MVNRVGVKCVTQTQSRDLSAVHGAHSRPRGVGGRVRFCLQSKQEKEGEEEEEKAAISRTPGVFLSLCLC